MCCAASYEFRLIDFVLLQMVHIFASQTNHFPPIKALFELVTSVTLTIFQQGRHAGINQLQRAKEIMWFWYLFCHCFQLFACICFLNPHTQKPSSEMGMILWNGSCFLKWCGEVAFDPVVLLEMFSPWISHTLRYRVFSH